MICEFLRAITWSCFEILSDVCKWWQELGIACSWLLAWATTCSCGGGRMPRRAVIEIKSEPWAKMQLLAHRADLSDQAVQQGCPTNLKLELGRWPHGNQSRERGVAACAVLKSHLPDLLRDARLDPNGPGAAEELYRYVFESGLDYWALAYRLRIDKLTREWLAMEGGVCRYVVWPKQEAQFFYATHLPRAINEC